MTTYRKRPIEVEARQFTDAPSADRIRAEFGEAIRFDLGCLLIDTLEGTMRASLGDWIVRGTRGEVYPVKPDIFAETYAPAVVSAPVQPTTRADDERRERQERYALAIHDAMEEDLSLADEDPAVQAAVARAAEAAMAVADDELRRVAGEEQPAPTAEHHTVDGNRYLCHTDDHYCPNGEEQLATEAQEPVCRFDEGCHRVIPCDPGCGVRWGHAARPAVVARQDGATT